MGDSEERGWDSEYSIYVIVARGKRRWVGRHDREYGMREKAMVDGERRWERGWEDGREHEKRKERRNAIVGYEKRVSVGEVDG